MTRFCIVSPAEGTHACSTADRHNFFGLQVTAAFFIYFVIDGVVTENVFELTAALVLDGLVLARVLFYIIIKKKNRFPGRIVLLSFITAFQLFILVQHCCTSWNYQ